MTLTEKKRRALRCLAHNRICSSYRGGRCRSGEPCSYKERRTQG